MQDQRYEERVALTRAIMYILDQWGLNAQALVSILGLPEGTPTRALRRYRENTPFPETDAVMERLDHVVAIADGLRTTFPLSAPMGALWMQKPNKRFGDRAPAQVLAEDGLTGLQTVRAHLDCAYAWHRTEPGTTVSI